MFKIKLLLFTILSFSYYQSKANFNFNDNCKSAYEAIFELRLNEAKRIISIEKSQHPENGITILLDNYIDYFSLLSSEKLVDYNQLKDRRSTRLALLEKQDKNSPYYLFCQAEVNLQWGMIKSRFQDYLSSGMDIKRARSLLLDNSKKFPSFLPNKKSLALIDVMLGAVPSNVKGVLNTFGLSGDIENGTKNLEYLANNLSKTPYAFYKDEVIFFLCYIETDIIKNASSYQKLINYTSSMDNSSLLKNYLQGYIAFRNSHNDDAISYLKKKPTKTGYIDFPAIDYLIGNAKLNRMDSDANVYLIHYLKDYHGINYIKDTYLKLSYYYYLKGDLDRYHSFIKLVKTQGNLYDEKDKQALKEANDSAPDIDLLKARFYFDGGYYNNALNILNKKNPTEFKLNRDLIEYNYRLGRIYDESGKDAQAVQHYNKAISLGKQTSYYYAANAALNVGKIFEQQKNKGSAVAYYKQAIAMKNHEYENSIETKAKEGLKRLGN